MEIKETQKQLREDSYKLVLILDRSGMESCHLKKPASSELPERLRLVAASIMESYHLKKPVSSEILVLDDSDPDLDPWLGFYVRRGPLGFDFNGIIPFSKRSGHVPVDDTVPPYLSIDLGHISEEYDKKLKEMDYVPEEYEKKFKEMGHIAEVNEKLWKEMMDRDMALPGEEYEKKFKEMGHTSEEHGKKFKEMLPGFVIKTGAMATAAGIIGLLALPLPAAVAWTVGPAAWLIAAAVVAFN